MEEMWRVLSVVRRRLWWRKERSARVADEGALGMSAGEAGVRPAGPVWRGGLEALVAVASCLVCQAEEEEEEELGWTSGRRPRDDEMNHLMMRDSMRYRIYV